MSKLATFGFRFGSLRIKSVLPGMIALAIVIPAMGQLENVERLIYVAKTIAKLVVREVPDSPSAADRNADGKRTLEVVAYDNEGREIEMTAADANELLKCDTSNAMGIVAIERTESGVIGQLESIENNVKKVRNVVRLVPGKYTGEIRLNVQVADNFASYSKAAGHAAISSGHAVDNTSMLKHFAKSAKNVAVQHPYLTAAGGVVVVGGIAAASGGGGGGGGSGEDTSAFAGRITGTWSGTIMEAPESGSLVMNISADGAVSGSYSGAYSGTLSGSVSGSGTMSGQGTAGGSVWSGQFTSSGGRITGSGSWRSDVGSGTWRASN